MSLRIKFSHIAFVVFCLLLAGVGWRVFGGEGEDSWSAQREVYDEAITVVYPERPGRVDPGVIAPAMRQVTMNVYEPLVRTDRDFRVRPALAVSWGMYDPYTWHFRVRPGVRFHDGSIFDAEDALASLARSRASGSELGDLLSTITKVEAPSALEILITTSAPDPLLLQKLSLVLMASQPQAVGTGPYQISASEDDAITLSRFEGYWGDKGRFPKVNMRFVTDKNERVRIFTEGGADLLAFVPHDAVTALEKYRLDAVPGVESQFLVFNSASLPDAGDRRAFASALDRAAFSERLGRYTTVLEQFVSRGVFGFAPDISFVFDADSAGTLLAESGLKGATLQLHLLRGLEVLGEFVRTTMLQHEVYIVVSYLDGPALMESMASGSADLYFLAFKSELGDAQELFDAVVHSGGAYNPGYHNPLVDAQIEQARVDLDVRHRRGLLQEVMRVITEEDAMGVPLFMYDTVYALGSRIMFSPRLDGVILFDDISLR